MLRIRLLHRWIDFSGDVRAATGPRCCRILTTVAAWQLETTNSLGAYWPTG